MEPIQPIVPEGTPLPPAPVGVPPYPITPFAVWTWSSPVIPEFYWNVYSAEQRIKMICKEIGKIEAYLNYLVNQTNKNLIEIEDQISKLTERVAQLERHVEEEVARLDGLIAQLRADLEQEIADREAGDTALGERIDQEILDRTHGDQTLHEEISQEIQDRIHADDQLHAEISQEVQDRQDADAALETRLTAAIAQRLLPTDVTAGEEISITRPDPSSNRIVIASTVAHSISELETSISGLQSALEAEVSERRADDSKLWQAVNNRIERGKILAGPGITVQNDPDSTTVTISATGGGAGGGKALVAGEGIEIEQDETQATISSTIPVAPAAVSAPQAKPTATGAYAMAVGESAEATGDYSIAIGDAASAHAHHAIAIGESSVATEERTVSFAKADGEGHRLTGVTDPRDDQDAATKAYVDRVATEHGGVVYTAGEGIQIDGTTISSTITQAPTLTAGEGIILDDTTPGELEISATPVAPPVEAPITSTDGTIGLSIDEDTLKVESGKLAVKTAALTGLNPDYGLDTTYADGARVHAGKMYGFLKREGGVFKGQLLPANAGLSRDLALEHYWTDVEYYLRSWISPKDAHRATDSWLLSDTGLSYTEAAAGKLAIDCRMMVANLRITYDAKTGESADAIYEGSEAYLKYFEQKSYTSYSNSTGWTSQPCFRCAQTDEDGRALKKVEFDYIYVYHIWVASDLLNFS